ncbi:hypothetical protein VB796_08830 [Arcicella sp. LKC2W]|uniref:hypothetical protein n=1 Tax=Arcicella sp. LKC2W TaxID=2984198 RepID=UPI002B2003D5|nr:hypothetical protein [Arcicella sp. LKC2W]MEA5459139.1 hypothetical protein [Arcicella sp. LKC2W]
MSKTATRELKEEFKSIKDKLPNEWIFAYIEKFHANDRGIIPVRVDRNLQNISKGVATPSPTQMKRIKQLIL